MWNPPSNFYNQIGTLLSHDRCDMKMASRIVPSTAIQTSCYTSFTVKYKGLLQLQSVGLIVLMEKRINCRRSSIPLW